MTMAEKAFVFLPSCYANMSSPTALHSSLCITPQKPLPPAVSSDSQQPNTVLASKPAKLPLKSNPLYTAANAALPFQVKEKILCLEVMGIDSGKALSLNPALRSASLHSIQSIIYHLQSKGIHQKDLPRIFGMCPQILTSSIEQDLNPVFNFLSNDLRVPEQSFRRVINKCPRLLASSVRDQLRPALFYLQRLGFRDLEALAYQDPVLLVSSVEKTLIPKLEFLQGIGFSKSEVVGMVLRCPGLFTFSVENNFKPKFEYFVGEMKGKLDELREFPQYFAFSLEKRIKPRHLEAVKRGLELPLSLMLKSTDEEFKDLIKQKGDDGSSV